ncbi:hypothetical protein KCU99_g50, partial [Aureobasidium melanogenum]
LLAFSIVRRFAIQKWTGSSKKISTNVMVIDLFVCLSCSTCLGLKSFSALCRPEAMYSEGTTTELGAPVSRNLTPKRDPTMSVSLVSHFFQ